MQDAFDCLADALQLLKFILIGDVVYEASFLAVSLSLCMLLVFLLLGEAGGRLLRGKYVTLDDWHSF